MIKDTVAGFEPLTEAKAERWYIDHEEMQTMLRDHKFTIDVTTLAGAHWHSQVYDTFEDAEVDFSKYVSTVEYFDDDGFVIMYEFNPTTMEVHVADMRFV